MVVVRAELEIANPATVRLPFDQWVHVVVRDRLARGTRQHSICGIDTHVSIASGARKHRRLVAAGGVVGASDAVDALASELGVPRRRAPAVQRTLRRLGRAAGCLVATRLWRLATSRLGLSVAQVALDGRVREHSTLLFLLLLLLLVPLLLDFDVAIHPTLCPLCSCATAFRVFVFSGASRSSRHHHSARCGASAQSARTRRWGRRRCFPLRGAARGAAPWRRDERGCFKEAQLAQHLLIACDVRLAFSFVRA